MGSQTHNRPWAFVGAALVLIVLAGCTGNASPAATPSPTEKSFEVKAREALSHLNGVAEIQAYAPSPHHATKTANLEVVMNDTATEKQAVAIAEATRKFSEENGPVVASVVIHAPIPADSDSTPANAVQFEVSPKPWKSAAGAARAVMAVRQIPGVASIAIAGSFPAVEVGDLSQLQNVLARVRTLELWKAGGDIRTAGGRVRITDLPGQLANSTIGAIVGQATRYSDGQFWIEAAKAGPSAPALYVDRVTVEQSQEIDAAFLDTVLEKNDQRTYPVPFHIRAIGPSGAIDTSGSFPGAKK